MASDVRDGGGERAPAEQHEHDDERARAARCGRRRREARRPARAAGPTIERARPPPWPRRQRACVLRPCSALTRRARAGCSRRRRRLRPAAAAGAAAGARAPPPARRRRRVGVGGRAARAEHVAAVGVLVDVGRQVVARLAQLATACSGPGGRRRLCSRAMILSWRCPRRAAGTASRSAPRPGPAPATGPAHRRSHASSHSAPLRRPPARAPCPPPRRRGCRPRRPPRAAAPSRARSAGSSRSRRSAAASAPASPAGTTSPVRSCATSPPAAAPTASVAITGTPWWKASLTTSPHGSRKSRVGIDGTTTTSLPAYKLRSSAGCAAGASAPGGDGRARRPSPPAAARCAPTPGRRAARRALLGARAARQTGPGTARGGRASPARDQNASSTLCGASNTRAGALGAHVGARRAGRRWRRRPRGGRCGAAAGRRARGPACADARQIVAHSTNGTPAARAPRYAAGSATRPESPATTARKRPRGGEPEDRALRRRTHRERQRARRSRRRRGARRRRPARRPRPRARAARRTRRRGTAARGW